MYIDYRYSSELCRKSRLKVVIGKDDKESRRIRRD